MISIVIPNYNGENILIPCLQALINQTGVEFEIIVVDNASQDKSIEILEKFGCKIIKNDINTGFAVAVNQGIKMAAYDYVFLLNSDVVVTENTLKTLLSCITSDESIFSVQPKMMQYYNPELIDDAGDIYTPLGWAFQLGHSLPDKYYNKTRETFTCCAGAALYRKSIFNEIGFFDENYFAYMEDVDIGIRARRNLYKNIVCADCKVYHIGSASFGKKMSSLRASLSGQNNYLTVRKNMPLIVLLLNLPFLILGFTLKWLKFVMLGFGKDFIMGIYKGHHIWNSKKYFVKFNLYDILLLFMMYRDTFLFIQWKIRQIMMKASVAK